MGKDKQPDSKGGGAHDVTGNGKRDWDKSKVQHPKDDGGKHTKK